MPDARLLRDHQEDRPGGTLDLLLPGLPALNGLERDKAVDAPARSIYIRRDLAARCRRFHFIPGKPRNRA